MVPSVRRLLLAAAFLAALCAQAARADSSTGLSAEVGLGPSYGIIGVGVEWTPVPVVGLFANYFGDDGIFSYALGLRAYPLGSGRTVNPFVHAYGWGLGIMGEDTWEYLNSLGFGAGVEFRFDEVRGARVGLDFSDIDGDPLLFPFVGYVEKF